MLCARLSEVPGVLKCTQVRFYEKVRFYVDERRVPWLPPAKGGGLLNNYIIIKLRSKYNKKTSSFLLSRF